MKSDSDAPPEVFDDPRAAAKARKRRRARSRVVRLLSTGAIGAVLLGLSALLKISHADYSAARGEVESREAQLHTLQAQQRSGHIRLAALQHEKGRAQSLIEHGYVRPGDRILLFPTTPQPSTTPPETPGSQAPAGTVGETGEAPIERNAKTVNTSKAVNALPTGAADAPAADAPAIPPASSTTEAAASAQEPPPSAAASGASRAASADVLPSPHSDSRLPVSASKPSSPLKPPSAWRRAGQTLQGWWQALRGAGAAPQSLPH